MLDNILESNTAGKEQTGYREATKLVGQVFIVSVMGRSIRAQL